MMVLKVSSATGRRLLGRVQVAGECTCQLVDGCLREDDPREAQQIEQVEAVRCNYVDVVQIACRTPEAVVALSEDDDRTRWDSQGGECFQQRLRFRCFEGERIDDRQRGFG